MKNIYVINTHEPYSFSKGLLNSELSNRISEFFKKQDFSVRNVKTSEGYNVEKELENHRWADLIVLQSPVNWMGVPWSFKKYMDEVYSAGMSGALCNGDGRTKERPKENYGNGGTLAGKYYLLSLTFNAPRESFEDPSEYLFQGKSVDDLFFPMHMNFRFFGMRPLQTFACYDVMKNPEIEADFERLEDHLQQELRSIK